MNNLNDYLLFNKESNEYNIINKTKINNLMNLYKESLHNYLFYLKNLLNDALLINNKLIKQKNY